MVLKPLLHLPGLDVDTHRAAGIQADTKAGAQFLQYPGEVREQTALVAWIWTAALILPSGALLMLDWDRYYLPGLIASSVVQGTVLGAACQVIARRVLRGRSASRVERSAASTVAHPAGNGPRSASVG